MNSKKDMTDLPPQSPVESGDPYNAGKRGRERSFGTGMLKKSQIPLQSHHFPMSQRAQGVRPNFGNIFSLAQWTDLTEHHTDTLLSVYPGISLAWTHETWFKTNWLKVVKMGDNRGVWLEQPCAQCGEDNLFMCGCSQSECSLKF